MANVCFKIYVNFLFLEFYVNIKMVRTFVLYFYFHFFTVNFFHFIIGEHLFEIFIFPGIGNFLHFFIFFESGVKHLKQAMTFFLFLKKKRLTIFLFLLTSFPLPTSNISNTYSPNTFILQPTLS